MIPDTPNPASAAARTGSGDIDCWAAIGTSDKPNARKYQDKFQDAAPITCASMRLRLVPPRPRRLEVRLHVLDGRCPYGRAGPFRLTDRDLDELIDHAMLLEARR